MAKNSINTPPQIRHGFITIQINPPQQALNVGAKLPQAAALDKLSTAGFMLEPALLPNHG